MNPEPYDEVTIVLDWKSIHSEARVLDVIALANHMSDFFLDHSSPLWSVVHLVNCSPKKQSLKKKLSLRTWSLPKEAREKDWYSYSIGIIAPFDAQNRVVPAPSLSLDFVHRNFQINRATVVLRMIAGGDSVSVFERTVGLLGEPRFGDDATVSCVLRCGTGDWMVAPDPIRSASGTISSSSSEITMALS